MNWPPAPLGTILLIFSACVGYLVLGVLWLWVMQGLGYRVDWSDLSVETGITEYARKVDVARTFTDGELQTQLRRSRVRNDQEMTDAIEFVIRERRE